MSTNRARLVKGWWWFRRILGKGNSMSKGTEAEGRYAKMTREVGDKAGEFRPCSPYGSVKNFGPYSENDVKH